MLALLASFALAAKSQRGAILHDCSGEKWNVTNEYGNITVPGNFPSQVHLDLYAAGVIGESLRRLLELSGMC